MAEISVFNTTELLEWILLELPFKDILRLKRVARNWKQTIERSIHLRRALFMVADGTPILPLPKENRGWLSTFLPTYPNKLLPLFEITDTEGLSPDVCPRPWQSRLRAEFIDDDGGWKSYFWWYLEHFDVTNGRLQIPRACRSMYLTQPPITACAFKIFSFGDGDGDVTIYDKKGVTLGLVADIAARMLRQFDETLGRDENRRDWREHLKENKAAASFRVYTAEKLLELESDDLDED